MSEIIIPEKTDLKHYLMTNHGFNPIQECHEIILEKIESKEDFSKILEDYVEAVNATKNFDICEAFLRSKPILEVLIQ